VQQLVKDLNHLYHDTPALFKHDFDWEGFEWIDCNDAQQSLLSYLRKTGDDFVIVVLNLTPVPRPGYRLGVPKPGAYTEVFNSDSAFYAGSNMGNAGEPMVAEEMPWMGRPYSISLTLPPLAGIILKLQEREPVASRPEPEEEEELS